MKTVSLICMSLVLLSLRHPLVEGEGGPLKGSGPAKDGAAHKGGPDKAKPLLRSKGPTVDVALACGMAKDKPFCIKALQTNPASKGADLLRLASVAIQMAQGKGMDVSDSLDDMLQDEETLPQDLNEALNDCSDQYSEALNHIQDVINSLPYNPIPYNDVRTSLAASISSSELCQRGILDVNPQNRRNKFLPNTDFARICDTALSILTIMQTNALKSGQAMTLT